MRIDVLRFKKFVRRKSVYIRSWMVFAAPCITISLCRKWLFRFTSAPKKKIGIMPPYRGFKISLSYHGKNRRESGLSKFQNLKWIIAYGNKSGLEVNLCYLCWDVRRGCWVPFLRLFCVFNFANNIHMRCFMRLGGILVLNLRSICVISSLHLS